MLYVNKFTREDAKKMTIKLPVDINGNPNFAYMEEYMQNLESAISSSLTALRSAKSSKTCEKVNIINWDKFEIRKLFDIRKGKRLTKANMIEYGTARHGRTFSGVRFTVCIR